jgi:hypothetical protein
LLLLCAALLAGSLLLLGLTGVLAVPAATDHLLPSVQAAQHALHLLGGQLTGCLLLLLLLLPVLPVPLAWVVAADLDPSG